MSVAYCGSTGVFEEGLLATEILEGHRLLNPSAGQWKRQLDHLLETLRVGTGGQLTEAVFIYPPRTGDLLVSFSEAETRESPLESPAERIAIIRAALSLNIRELARVLLVERPTVYSWISGAQPRRDNAERLRILAELARQWNTLNPRPLGNLRKDSGSDGVSILFLLERDSIDSERVLELFKAAAEKLRSQPKPGLGLAERARKRGVVLAEPPDAQREIDRLTGKRIAPE